MDERMILTPAMIFSIAPPQFGHVLRASSFMLCKASKHSLQ